MHPVLEDQSLEPVVLDTYFAASPARVFEAWSNPKSVLKWFGKSPKPLQSAEIDLRVGGKWRFVKSASQQLTVALEGRYLEVVANRRLRYTWRYVTTSASGQTDEQLHAEVDVTFTPKGEGTNVRLEHLPQRIEDSRDGIDEKWSLAFVDLRAVFCI